MFAFLRVTAPALAVLLLAAAPRHVLTADYWGGYAGTHNVPAQTAAQWLSWAEVDSQDSAVLAPLGVKTLLYSNPNRLQPGNAISSSDESIYAHTCGGGRAQGESRYRDQYLSDVRSGALLQAWRYFVSRHMIGAHFDAVFDDEADGDLYAVDQPCNYSLQNWIAGEAGLIRGLGDPVIYNGLSDFSSTNGVAPEIALNAVAAGGMMEQCYAQLRPDHRVGGWQWSTTELTEIEMARQRKIFMCYGRDLTPAQQAYASRLYTYASFLLTYDPHTSVLWEYYQTPSGGHVMPESQLVALDPVKRVAAVPELRDRNGVYLREYRRCFIDGRPVGACAAAVNPDDDPHPLSLPGYRRILELRGSGVFDGGSVRVINQSPPPTLQPLEAVIAFK